MEILDIKFNNFLGIEKSGNHKYIYKIQNKPDYLNHLETIHASVEYAVCEATSGYILQTSFPEFADTVVPILRRSAIKYSKPAMTGIFSTGHIDEIRKEKFINDLRTKGRALIEVNIELYDIEDKRILTAEFEWFVTMIDK